MIQNKPDEIHLPKIGLRMYRDKFFIKTSEKSYGPLPPKIYYVILGVAQAHEAYNSDPENYPTPIVSEQELSKRLRGVMDPNHPNDRLFSASRFCVADLLKSDEVKAIFNNLVAKEKTLRGAGPAFRLRIPAAM